MEFDQSIEEYLCEKRNKMLKEFSRVLPSNELLFDRWEKAKLLKCGENTTIYDSSVIMGNIKVGANVWIGPFTVIEGINGIVTIGDFCHISSGVQIVTHDSVEYVLTGGKAEFKKGDIHIANNSYIGGMSIITKGVSIGNHCVIGANSLVNMNIPDFTIAHGTPIRIVGKVIVDEEKVRFEY
ncbi:MAG: acetyltransferase [Firmicutes bacterium HGW-Firmicutes-1]|jgi:acetyltransferase-like isoleucine patch superfamily enzyme|nr:MAG: acetyltransferase [Firmicutes bacterium HGW-Firmicutes-1]